MGKHARRAPGSQEAWLQEASSLSFTHLSIQCRSKLEALNVHHSNVILIKNKKLRLCKVSIHDAKTKPQLRPTGYGSWIEEGGASLAVDRYNTTTVLQYNLLYKQQFLNITTKRRSVKHFSIFFTSLHSTHCILLQTILTDKHPTLPQHPQGNNSVVINSSTGRKASHRVLLTLPASTGRA